MCIIIIWFRYAFSGNQNWTSGTCLLHRHCTMSYRDMCDVMVVECRYDITGWPMTTILGDNDWQLNARRSRLSTTAVSVPKTTAPRIAVSPIGKAVTVHRTTGVGDHLPVLGLWACRWYKPQSLGPMRCQTYGYLSSFGALLPLH